MRTSLIVLCLALASAPGAGQVIQGRTMDAGSRAWVPATLLTLLTESGDSLLSTLSDESGEFELLAPDAGPYRLRAQRIGYSDVTTSVVTVKDGESVTVEVLLGADPVSLDPLNVTSRRFGGRGLIGAHRRRADWIQRTGIGRVITRADLDRQVRPYVTDYLYTISGMRVVGAGHDAQVRIRGCSPQIFVDGIRTPGLSVNAMSPDALEGIEIYRSVGEMPPELRNVGGCGAIAMYTRQGEPTTGKWTLLQKIFAGAGVTALATLLFTQF